MKVYAVIKRCDDDYYPDYTIVDDRVYLKEEDAKKKLEERIEKKYWMDHDIYEFDVIE